MAYGFYESNSQYGYYNGGSGFGPASPPARLPSAQSFAQIDKPFGQMEKTYTNYEQRPYGQSEKHYIQTDKTYKHGVGMGGGGGGMMGGGGMIGGGGGNPFSDLVPSSFGQGMDPKVVAGFRMADKDGSGFIDEKELKAALASCGLTFTYRTVRLMVNTFTYNKSRMMGPKEFSAVYSGLQEWKGIFQRFDRDRNGKIESSELREALQALGLQYPISSMVLDSLIMMFDKNGGYSHGIGFESFIECCLTVKGLTEKFKEKDNMCNGKATFTYESFMLAVLAFIVA